MKHLMSLGVILTLVAITSCNDPSELETVSGIEGRIEFQGSLPDSIKAVALVVLKPEAANDRENIGKYLVAYSEPTTESSEYFVQLKSGGYLGVIVGLLIDPGLFVVNIDSYLASADIPLIQLTEAESGTMFIGKGQIFYRDWDIQF